jgi:hypothetical protein
MVLDALKKGLHDAANSKGGKWIKELPNALWGLHTPTPGAPGRGSRRRSYGELDGFNIHQANYRLQPR